MKQYPVIAISCEEIDEMRREAEVLRKQVDAARQLSTEAWDLVTRLSRPLTEREKKEFCMWGYDDAFIEIMRRRQENRA